MFISRLLPCCSSTTRRETLLVKKRRSTDMLEYFMNTSKLICSVLKCWHHYWMAASHFLFSFCLYFWDLSFFMGLCVSINNPLSGVERRICAARQESMRSQTLSKYSNPISLCLDTFPRRICEKMCVFTASPCYLDNTRLIAAETETAFFACLSCAKPNELGPFLVWTGTPLWILTDVTSSVLIIIHATCIYKRP